MAKIPVPKASVTKVSVTVAEVPVVESTVAENTVLEVSAAEATIAQVTVEKVPVTDATAVEVAETEATVAEATVAEVPIIPDQEVIEEFLVAEFPVARDNRIERNDWSSDNNPSGNLQSSNCAVPVNGRQQLLFFYDCETTGGSHYTDHIIEVAATVIVPTNLSITSTATEFSSLCHTSHPISPMGKQAHSTHIICILCTIFCLSASMLTGITAKMLVGQPSFSSVFRKLLEWIKQCIQEACSDHDIYYPGM